ncbi:MAG: hypothetical protein AAGA09_01640 [Pseudomonadota bacterium]
MSNEARYPLQWQDGVARTKYYARTSSDRFKVTWDKALDELESEVDLMGAANEVISSWLPLGRRGNALAGQARRHIDDPGVAVYFTKDNKRLCIAVDKYDTPLGNLRAIGLALKALRDLERHGGGHLLTTAMKGFEALPSDDHWWTTLDVDRSAPLPEIKTAWLRKMKSAHPDAGGNDVMAARINDAWTRAQAERH